MFPISVWSSRDDGVVSWEFCSGHIDYLVKLVFAIFVLSSRLDDDNVMSWESSVTDYLLMFAVFVWSSSRSDDGVVSWGSCCIDYLFVFVDTSSLSLCGI